jgi:hypothetical protein
MNKLMGENHFNKSGMLPIPKCTKVVALKCISDDIEKRSKIIKTYELKNTGRFVKENNIKNAQKNVHHAQFSGHYDR